VVPFNEVGTTFTSDFVSHHFIASGLRSLISARPIPRINAFLNQAMKRRIRPICNAFDQAMFQRIDMHIIHVRPKIAFMPDPVFPISPLP
jgi:hypothetical protein